MKTSAIKIVRSLFDKKNIIKLKKFINKKNLIISPVFIGIVVISYYFFKPTFFDYETNKEVLEKKINDYLKIETKIEGDISYHFFPKPRVVAKGIKINFEGSGKEKIKFEETNFLISIFKLKSLEEFEL